MRSYQKKFIPKIKDLSSEPLIGVKEPLKDMLAACGVIIVYLPILDNITSTCITYSKGNSIVLGIPTEDTDGFWQLLGEALHNLVERDYQRSNRKYRNNDPVTVVNYQSIFWVSFVAVMLSQVFSYAK